MSRAASQLPAAGSAGGPYDSVRDFLNDLEARGRVERIPEMDQDAFEMTAFAYRLLDRLGYEKAPAFVVERVKIGGQWREGPVLGNQFGSWVEEALVFGVQNVSEDGKTYSFTLREGAKFGDGSPVTASDVKFSIERLRDGEGSVFGSMFTVISAIDVPDDRTVVFTLAEPTTPFLSILALFAAAILPEAAVTGDYDAFAEKPIGAGAFRLADWRRGDRIVLDRPDSVMPAWTRAQSVAHFLGVELIDESEPVPA